PPPGGDVSDGTLRQQLAGDVVDQRVDLALDRADVAGACLAVPGPLGLRPADRELVRRLLEAGGVDGDALGGGLHVALQARRRLLASQGELLRGALARAGGVHQVGDDVVEEGVDLGVDGRLVAGGSEAVARGFCLRPARTERRVRLGEARGVERGPLGDRLGVALRLTEGPRAGERELLRRARAASNIPWGGSVRHIRQGGQALTLQLLGAGAFLTLKAVALLGLIKAPTVDPQ